MTKIIFALWDSSESAIPEQAAKVMLWSRAWSRRGFTPRLLTARTLKRFPKAKIYPVTLINFLYRARELPPIALARHWRDPAAWTAVVVNFEGATVQQMLDYGREI